MPTIAPDAFGMQRQEDAAAAAEVRARPRAAVSHPRTARLSGRARGSNLRLHTNTGRRGFAAVEVVRLGPLKRDRRAARDARRGHTRAVRLARGDARPRSARRDERLVRLVHDRAEHLVGDPEWSQLRTTAALVKESWRRRRDHLRARRRRARGRASSRGERTRRAERGRAPRSAAGGGGRRNAPRACAAARPRWS